MDEHCEHLQGCPVFRAPEARSKIKHFQIKSQFCAGDKHKCARYAVSSKVLSGYAPVDEGALKIVEHEMTSLCPSDMRRANEIMKNMVMTFFSELPCL